MCNNSVNEDIIKIDKRIRIICYVIFVVVYITVELIELDMKEA